MAEPQNDNQDGPLVPSGDLRIAAVVLAAKAAEMRDFWRGRDGVTAEIERAEADVCERVAAWLKAQANG